MPDLPNFNALLMEGFNTGREMKRQDGLSSALATYATNPEDPSAIGEIARFDPRAAIQLRQGQQQQQAAQQKAMADQQQARIQQMTTTAKLLDDARDEPSYQQSLAAARQLGLDVSSAPPSYDPAWVGQQRMIVGAFTKDNGSQISGIARELSDAGYQPGTPEFAEAMRGVIQNKYASDYVDEQGNTRRRSALSLGGGPAATMGAPAAPMQAPGAQGRPADGGFMTLDQAKAIGQGTNFLGWQKRFGTPVMVRNPQEAASLPAGTIIMSPDGRRGVKR